jgi:hypothetical protein
VKVNASRSYAMKVNADRGYVVKVNAVLTKILLSSCSLESSK